MSTIDTIIIIIIIIGGIRGAYKGVIKQITSLGGLLLGIVVCRLFGDEVSSAVMHIMPEIKDLPACDVMASIIGHVLLFAFVYLSVALAGTLMKSLTHSLHLGMFDNILGVAMCILKYLLGLSLVLNLWFVLSPNSSIFTSSKLLDGSIFRFVLNLGPCLLDSEIIPTTKAAIQSVAG
ncbi:MAG: CvpA family protein [Muribaculaceae bacterium]